MPAAGRRLIAAARDLRAATVGIGLLLAAGAQAAPVQGFVAAEGGGSISRGTWAPQVFGWMLRGAGGEGRVIVLGVRGEDEAAAEAFLAAGATSVRQLAVTPENADLRATYDAIASAQVVWMRGGDQSKYVTGWASTRTEAAIRAVFDGGGAVGGTSAGCAVLGEVIFDARAGSLRNRAALRDPACPKFSFTDDFLGLVPGVLFDTHFTERGRLARLGVQLARLRLDRGRSLLGVGIDDRTAFCVAPDGTATVFGEGTVTLLRLNANSQVELAPGRAPLITDLAHTQLVAGYRFDLATRAVIERPQHARLPPPATRPAGAHRALELHGSCAADAARGALRVLDDGDDAALVRGTLRVVPGSGNLPRAVVVTRAWNSTEWDENRIGGAQYALSRHPDAFALYLDGGTVARSTGADLLEFLPCTEPASPAVILDACGVRSVAGSEVRRGAAEAEPRQSVALEGATLHFLPPGWSYDLLQRTPVRVHAPDDF